MDGLMLPANLPNSATARLPQVYEAARVALAECSRIDECAEWANKAEALASYARQAEDSSLRQMADRIQARAIRRCGELLKQIEPDKGGRPSETQEGALPRLTRTTVATEAGLSEHQRKTALRVASVPADVFEREVESEAKAGELEAMGRGCFAHADELRQYRSMRASNEAA
jgi:hypothetical protein